MFKIFSHHSRTAAFLRKTKVLESMTKDFYYERACFQVFVPKLGAVTLPSERGASRGSCRRGL